MYCYVYYRPNIVYGVTTLSKLSSTPSDYQYSCLKKLTIYLQVTRDGGIRYKRRGPQLDIPEPKLHLVV